MKTDSSVRAVAFVGDYLPRQCGIASFTSDLLGAVAGTEPPVECWAVSVNDIAGGYRYPDAVRCEIEERDPASYRRAAAFLNSSGVDAISLQHEFGIYGGPAGGHLLALLRDLRMPVVTTLHTVRARLNYHESRVMRELLARSARVVVMTERARAILRDLYRVSPARIDVIPLGISGGPYIAPSHYQERLGLVGKQVLLTFGLLYPHKGIEHVLHALPEVAAEFPDVLYIVLGATHPCELGARGETYRQRLEAIVRERGIEKHVVFDNRYVDPRELAGFIAAADIYLTPYLGEEQASSGTLANAFGAGKPVVSTPYCHAAELLRDGRGVLVPFADAAAIARELRGLLRDPARRQAMADGAYELGREMVWSNVARLYLQSFAVARLQWQPAQRDCGGLRSPGAPPRELPKSDLRYVYHLLIRPFCLSARELLHRTYREAAARIATPVR